MNRFLAICSRELHLYEKLSLSKSEPFNKYPERKAHSFSQTLNHTILSQGARPRSPKPLRAIVSLKMYRDSICSNLHVI